MTPIKQAVQDYRYAILNLGEETQQQYMHRLSVFAAWCEREGVFLEDIRQAHLRKFTEFLRSEHRSPQTGKSIVASTIHGYLRTLKAFINWMTREEDYDGMVSEKLARRIEMPRVEQKVLSIFTPEQIKALLAACEEEYNQKLRIRDRAIISVLVDTGIRASELCGLTLDCVFMDPYDAHLKVFGKGSKWREVPLGKLSLVALRRYITRYRHASKEEQHVFLNRADEPLTIWGLDQLIERLGKWTRIEGVRCSPHTFRHTFSVNFLQATGDIYRLSRVLGHTSITITEIYVRATSNQAARRGVSVLDKML